MPNQEIDHQKSSSSGGGCGCALFILCALISSIFIVLKISGLWEISWLVAFSPVLVILVFYAIMAIFALVIGLFILIIFAFAFLFVFLMENKK